MKDSTNLVILAIGFVIGVIIAKSTPNTLAYAASSSDNKQVYHNGPVFTNGKIRLIFWGDFSRANPGIAQIDAKMRALQASTYFNVLSEYKINKPLYMGYTNYKSIPRNGWDHSDILKVLAATYPTAEDSTVYFIIPQPGTKPHDGGTSYNSWVTTGGHVFGVFREYYGYNIDSITDAMVEEAVEAITNPYNTGWHAGASGKSMNPGSNNAPQYEMIDVCMGNTARVNGVKVTGIWSNRQNRCVFG